MPEWERHDQEEFLRFERANNGDIPEEEEAPMNDRSTLKPVTFPAQRNKLPLISEAGLLNEHEVKRRADLYWRQRNTEFKRGWRQAHPKPFLFMPALLLALACLVVFALGWWLAR